MKKIWRVIKYPIYATCVIFAVSFGIVIIVGQWHRPVGKADAIIVLGAAIKTPAAYNRALEGLKIYNQKKAPVLVLSGGLDYPKSISEAEYMENAVTDAVWKASAGINGIIGTSPGQSPSFAIGATDLKYPNMILEPNSQSTFENIQFSKKLIPQAKSVIIVSDTYHLARGVFTAKSAGFSPVYWSSPETAAYYPFSELAFHYLRETVAMISYLPKFVLGK